MPVLSLSLEAEEVAGLSTLIAQEARNAGRGSDEATRHHAATMARALLREALAGKLESAGLPWPPSAESVTAAQETVHQNTGRQNTGHQNTGHQEAGHREERPKIIRKYLAYVLAVAVVVVLIGGYGGHWAWTGFQKNGQLWDWLTLLVLPVVVGAVPLWIRYRQHISTFRRISHGTAFAAWVALVIAGYLLPLAWTGFTGQTLWDWLSLFLAPIAVAAAATVAATQQRVPEILRSLRPYQSALGGALIGGFVISVIGGYALGWTWTGYAGNTLWDWLQLLLLPVVVPTVLLPGLLKWVAGEEALKASEPAPAPKPSSFSEASRYILR